MEHNMDAFEDLQYIHCKGKHLIIIPFIPNQDTQIDCEVKVLNKSTLIYNSWPQKWTGVGLYVGSRATAWFSNYNLDDFGFDTDINVWYNTQHIKNLLYIDNILTVRHTYSNFSTGLPIRLFNTSLTDAYDNGNLHMRSFDVYNNGIIAHKLRPMIRKSDQKPCLFDSITNKPFFNQARGEFGYMKVDGTYVAPI